MVSLKKNPGWLFDKCCLKDDVHSLKRYISPLNNLFFIPPRRQQQANWLISHTVTASKSRSVAGVRTSYASLTMTTTTKQSVVSGKMTEIWKRNGWKQKITNTFMINVALTIWDRTWKTKFLVGDKCFLSNIKKIDVVDKKSVNSILKKFKRRMDLWGSVNFSLFFP